MKKSTKIIIGVVVSLAVIIAAVAAATPNMVFNFIFSRPERSTKVPSYYVDTPHYKVSQAGLKVMKTYKSEDAYMESFDGLKLHAYVYPADEKPKKFVIGVHGYR